LNRDLIGLTAVSIIAFGILVGLGIWQLQRLEFKQELAAQIRERTTEQPVPLSRLESVLEKAGDIEYRRVRFKGTFHHDGESHYFTVINGRTGWRVITPLETVGGKIVMVDRGFVPANKKQAQTRQQGQLEGEQTVIGLARAPGTKGTFTPENSLEKNNWFWRDLSGMAAAALPASDLKRVLPFFVEQEKSSIPGGWPRGDVTRVKMSNKHLQYALTWFGLAGALFVVFILVLRGRFREQPFT
jgi:surfeit locus 1 family protein